MRFIKMTNNAMQTQCINNVNMLTDATTPVIVCRSPDMHVCVTTF